MTGMTLRAALQLARERGCVVQRLTRLNARRKDSPRILTVLLRRLEDAVQKGGPSMTNRTKQQTPSTERSEAMTTSPDRIPQLRALLDESCNAEVRSGARRAPRPRRSVSSNTVRNAVWKLMAHYGVESVGYAYDDLTGNWGEGFVPLPGPTMATRRARPRGAASPSKKPHTRIEED
jgi:hypothetical protein